MSESQVSKDSKNQDSKNRESKNQQLEERKRGEQELEERKRGGEGGSEGEFGTKCAKCMDPCVKIALITFPIFLIASILIGILGLSSQASKNNNSTDPSSPVLSSSVPVRNVTRFKVPTSTSTIFRSDIIHTAPAGSNGDEDTHFYSILFLVLALTSLIVIFCGKYWTIGLYNPPPDTIDRDTDRSFAQSQPIAGNRVLLEEQITTV